MKLFFTPILFFLLLMLPLLGFAQNEENNHTDTKTNRKRVIIIEQDELNELKEEIRIDLKGLKAELKNAFKQLEDVDWEEVDEEIEIAMEEARQGLEEANNELSTIRIEIDEDFEEELNEGLEEIREELGEIRINNGSPRIRIMSQNNRPYKNNRNVERNFSELNAEPNLTLSDKMKKGATTSFDESVQNSVKITPQTKEGKFTLNFSLSENKADKKTTYIEVYDSEGNVMYFESLVDFSGSYQGEIDLAINGTDTYTLVVRQGTKYFSRKINLK
ncbi:hypothetical protein Fleli_0757 [Bernardetia litoralis DSM 6794]|uniref:Uncharacterized protein n=1 Tax=Bernardetia litoralis (strain ATCC 23117 / DSM 6794 / NBRC 15988 / NCIMB 1366 / Fx l1 / Sio-4) TaxID=880071 RepID=I4AGY2_BERLS|nr:hypothetical protein [Bernardetia litoralis]AFM03217.1 hypothetical protein Fleli_0757 [Bernardetia litoralis DSM 6794]